MINREGLKIVLIVSVIIISFTISAIYIDSKLQVVNANVVTGNYFNVCQLRSATPMVDDFNRIQGNVVTLICPPTPLQEEMVKLQ